VSSDLSTSAGGAGTLGLISTLAVGEGEGDGLDELTGGCEGAGVLVEQALKTAAKATKDKEYRIECISLV
jgi:hypothetical protein